MCELFSPSRLMPFARKLGFELGWAMDIKCKDELTGQTWDLSDLSTQNRVISMVRGSAPMVIVMSPPGNRRELVSFCMRVAFEQHRHGRYFVFEQPLNSNAWDQTEVYNIMMKPGVDIVSRHMHEIGLRPTRILSNMPAVIANMSRMPALRPDCPDQQRLPAGPRQTAGKRPNEVYRSLVKCFDVQYRADCQRTSGADNIMHLMSIGGHDGHEILEAQWYKYVDDRTGKTLSPEHVQQARREEIRTLEGMKVFRRVPREEALEMGAKIIKTRWIDTDKSADPSSPDVRSRCVAKEFANGEMDDIFSPTPALEAIKIITSGLASSNGGRAPTDRLMVMDIKRAFLYAPMERLVAVELPEEAKTSRDDTSVGLLLRAMYGTRDAPMQWQSHVSQYLRSLGFIQGKGHPCVYYHPKKLLRMAVHVDDFLVSGSLGSLRWLQYMMREAFEFKAEILGPGAEEKQMVTYLNRELGWTQEGITYQPDPRHVKTVLREMGMLTCSPVSTPGVKELHDKESTGELSNDQKFKLRRVIAILNYTSQDRPDIGFAVKECARSMSNPDCVTEASVIRLLRYLRGHERCVTSFRWQSRPATLRVLTDSDWGGCRWTRRSTSGGVAMVGNHLVRHWSKTQSTVALSSGEAELYSLVLGSAVVLNLQGMMGELGYPITAAVATDSTAARGTVQRTGCGKLKHVSINKLWVQEKAANKEVRYDKVPRTLNPSDLLTHHWNNSDGRAHMDRLGVHIVRDGTAANLHS